MQIVIEVDGISNNILDKLKDAIVKCLDNEARNIKDSLEVFDPESTAYAEMKAWMDAANEQATSVRFQYRDIQDKKLQDYKAEEERKWKVRHGYSI